MEDQIIESTHVASEDADYVDRNTTPRYTIPASKVTQLQQLYSQGNPETLHTGKQDQRSPTKGELRHKTSFLAKLKTAKTQYQLRTVKP